MSEAVEVLLSVADAFGRRMTEKAAESFIAAIGQIDEHVIIAAIRKAASNADTMPNPATVRSIAWGIINEGRGRTAREQIVPTCDFCGDTGFVTCWHPTTIRDVAAGKEPATYYTCAVPCPATTCRTTKRIAADVKPYARSTWALATTAHRQRADHRAEIQEWLESRPSTGRDFQDQF